MLRLLIVLLLAAPLAANDLALSLPGGDSAWFLLGPSPAPHLPGLPSPDVLGRRAAARPQLELWRYENIGSPWTREAKVAVKGTYLYAVFAIADEPYVLISQPGPHPTAVLRARALDVAGPVPADKVALALGEFADAPAVSPDGTKLVLRVFRGGSAVLAVYSTADWSPLAESPASNFSRPVWINSDSLACIASDADISRVTLGDGSANPAALNQNPRPEPGKLLRLELDASTLNVTELLVGEFPPETFTRALARDACSGGVILARKQGEGVVVEQRAAAPQATPLTIASFEHFRGIAVGGAVVRCMGVQDGQLRTARLRRWAELRVPGLPFQPARVLELPLNEKHEVRDYADPAVSPSGLGGLIDLGRGFHCLIEPAANPDYAQPGQPLCLHTVRAESPGLRRCDSMANAHNLVRVSGLARRFAELEARYKRGIPSTLLAFDLTLNLDKATPKKGTYVELYHGDGRGGQGRIRTEDNLSGTWLMNSIDGGGTAQTDWLYTCADIRAGSVEQQSPARSRKQYDDMLTQLGARRLLMLGDPAAGPEAGGLRFMWQGILRNPVTGARQRVWEFERLEPAARGRDRQSATLRFCADLPATPQGWACPHSLVHADLAVAVAGKDQLGFTSVTFSHEDVIALPNLTAREHPPLLLPRQFWLHERDEAANRLIQRVHAVAHGGEIAHPVELSASGKLRPGYYVPGLSVPVIMRETADSMFRRLQRR